MLTIKNLVMNYNDSYEHSNKSINKLIIDNKGGSETQVLMQYEIGENEVKDSDKEKRIVNVSDKLPLYKHILMTEKYNFNLIKWVVALIVPLN